ncbi:MAG: hypothetical protein LBL58_03095 [Tannerellaceae bacterium]|jgi:hypothetical protein|nr:hypothetical protein [Tannerellaceae bacterium]
MIVSKFFSVQDAIPHILDIYFEAFYPFLLKQDDEKEDRLEYTIHKKEVEEKLKELFSQLRTELTVLIETNYIDKVYRDCYYKFFSTKLDPYPRNCIRISLFDYDLNALETLDSNTINEINKKFLYLGSIVIRPTFPNIIGRSVISPKALCNHDFKICATKFSTTACGIQFKTFGFPHASQDGQILSCAETTLWSIMEYFGTKFSEYATILPSKIIKLLADVSDERQLPSTGLTVSNISYVLKKLGLEPKIYSSLKAQDFESLLNCYIQSGIPLVVSVNFKVALKKGQAQTEDKDKNRGDNNHAIICIGHTKEVASECESTIANYFQKQPKTPSLKIFDWEYLAKEYILMDDSTPAYRKATFSRMLTLREKDKEKYDIESQIKHFVAPLYHRVYMDARFAKEKMHIYINERKNLYPLKNVPNKVILRTLLAPSRLYKQYIICNMGNNGLNKELKNAIVSLEMPKFIWVGEISAFDFSKEIDPETQMPLVRGLIILDSTEICATGHDAVLLICDSEVITYRDSSGEIISLDISKMIGKSVPLQSFKRFENLKDCITT